MAFQKSPAQSSQTTPVSPQLASRPAVTESIDVPRASGSANYDVIPTEFSPLSVSGLIYWIDSDYTTNSGDGTNVTAATDLSGQGNVTVASASPPKFRSTRWNYNQTAIDFANQALLVTSGPASTLYSVGQAYTMFAIFQPRNHNANYLCAWTDATSAAFARQRTHRWETNGYKLNVQGNTITGGDQATKTNSFQWVPAPHLVSYRSDGTSDFYEDELNTSGAIANTWTGTLSTSRLCIGGIFYNGGSFFTSDMLLRAFLLYNRKLTDAEVATVRLYLGQAYGLNWMAAYGASGPTTVFTMDGQSNMVGQETACLDSHTYAMNNANAFMIGTDGIYKALSEPSHDPTNKVDPFNLYTNTGYGASMAAAVANQLQARGYAEKLLFIPCASVSTTSQSWALNISGSPIFDNLGPLSIYRTLIGMRAPGAKLCVLIDQGEANADSAANATQWQTDWATIMDRYVAFFGSGAFRKSKRFIVGRLSININGTGGFESNLRAAEDALLGARTDMLLPQRGDATACSGSTLHQRMANFRDVYGPLIGNTFFDAV
jgi:hypothetical protein